MEQSMQMQKYVYADTKAQVVNLEMEKKIPKIKAMVPMYAAVELSASDTTPALRTLL